MENENSSFCPSSVFDNILSLKLFVNHTLCVFFLLAGESAIVLPSVSEQLQALNERVHSFAFDIVFVQIRQQLAQTPKLQVRSFLIVVVVFFCL